MNRKQERKKHEWLQMYASKFTSAKALARETIALIESSSYNVSILFDGEELFEPEKLYQEFEGVRLFRRVKVKEMVDERGVIAKESK